MPGEIRIGIIGLGTIGAGVVKTLAGNRDMITSRLGREIKVVKACDRIQQRKKGLELGAGIFTTDFNEIINDPSIGIVVELIGGTNPAEKIITMALKSGKNVVTANKELLAKRGSGLFQTARDRGRALKFEASVGGGIPIIHAVEHCLSANKIRRVIGIINGTTNYILTAMTENSEPYDQVLESAIRRGYAEADPTSDVEGYDAAYKAVLLAGIAFKASVPVEKVYREGITNISSKDIKAAGEMGYVIKLLAVAEETDLGLDVRVHPAFIPLAHPLSSVNGVYNGIFVQGDPVGNLMFLGRGAGADATSSAVISDIIEIGAAPQGADLTPAMPYRASKLVPIGNQFRAFYLRMSVNDSPGVLSKISGVFGRNGVSLASVVQRTPPGGEAEISWITHQVQEHKLQRALKTIRNLDCVMQVQSVIRVEDGAS